MYNCSRTKTNFQCGKLDLVPVKQLPSQIVQPHIIGRLLCPADFGSPEIDRGITIIVFNEKVSILNINFFDKIGAFRERMPQSYSQTQLSKYQTLKYHI